MKLDTQNEMNARFLALLPHWKCHKVVQAGRISLMARDEPNGMLMVHAEPSNMPFAVPLDFLRRHNPEIGGYFTVYEDGYISYSPAAAFEAGYSLIIDKDSNGTVLTQNADGTESLYVDMPAAVTKASALLRDLDAFIPMKTVTDAANPTAEPLPGYRPVQSMVYCGIYTEDGSKYPDLRDALEKLQLNDASLSFEPESSAALGFGFRCGFLGLLHMEIVQERLEREFDQDLITTAPSVVFKLHMKDGEVRDLHNPADMPDLTYVDHIEEPRIKATIMVPDEYLGDVLKLCQDRRGIQMDLTYAGNRAMVVYDLPLAEVVFDFYDRLKSVTKGYASFDYQLSEYREDFLVKMSILVNDEPVDALSMPIHVVKS